MTLVSEAWSVLLALAPWLLLGAALAGVLHVLLPPAFIHRRFRGYGGVIRAVVRGAIDEAAVHDLVRKAGYAPV
jgi:uncharacterized protein